MSKFLKSRSGNFAIISAILMIPIFAAVGLGVDYTKASETQSNAQNAADAAVLAAAEASDASMGERKKIAKKVFLANLDQNNLGSVRTADLKRKKKVNTYEYSYSVTLNYNTYFARVFGKEDFKIGVLAKASVGQQAYDVALVLDTTGSMSVTNKIDELKKAADLFVSNFSSDGSMRIAIVPFDTQVRLDDVSFGSNLLIDQDNPLDLSTNCGSLSDPYDQLLCQQTQTAAASSGIPADSCDTSSSTDSYGNTTTTTICVSYTSTTKTTTTTANTTNSSGSTTSSSSSSASEPYTPPSSSASLPQPMTSKTNDTITANSDLLGVDKDNWSGCVIDREQPYDVSSESVLRKVEASQYPKAYCATDTLAPILELTSNMSKVRQEIDKLEPAGNTNITIGVQWGMEALSPPYPLRVTGANGRKKLMIVLTDGMNTQNRWTTDPDAIDKRTKMACDNAKDEGIEMMTIRLIDGNRALLKSCASNPDNYFEVSDSSLLSTVFRSIAEKIKNVRLTG